MSLRWPTIVILLVLGVVLSVLVSWRCAMFSRVVGGPEALSSNDVRAIWIKYVNDTIRGKGLVGRRYEGRGITEIDASYEASESTSIFYLKSCMLVRTGWPWRCLERERHYSVDPNYVSKLQDAATLILPQKLGPIHWGGRHLPLRVLWVGMIFNTLCYAFLSGLFIVALQKLRQRIRLDRKTCPQCNYNLCKSITPTGAVCPECSYKISINLFERPRFLLRWWMVPMLLPLFALFLAWTIGLVNLYRLRYYMYWEYPVLEFKVFISLLIGFVFLFIIAFGAYHDRSAKQRISIAGAVAFMLCALTYLPIYALAVIYETWPY